MGFLRAQVTLAADTSVPSDGAQNVWHFNTSGAIDTGLCDDATTVLTAFYNDLGDFWASSLTGGMTIKYYDLEDAEPRVPVATHNSTFAVETDSLPAEAAVCLSMHGVLGSGVNSARRKGRIFLGPCAKAVCAIEDDAARVAGTFTSNIAAAAATLLTDGGSLGLILSVFSPTQFAGGGGYAGAFSSVIGGHVDNAFDTQRRRGPEASLRVLWPD